ncbi:hypothetical protein E2562_002145 [Oryza meyeriana var. granulata]|uniref:Uncharacterized protein n=1 Tax=Oryza meyeriana var. granulata TaxID=110450 RepID=A0A6G1EDS0_9ORYZ|nr:hypothetical protein E2562_002145 [Oryza meyeriana var. granulata]
MPSLLDSPLQPVAGDWSSLYAAQEPVKAPPHGLVGPAPAAAKKPAYGGGRRIKNLEMCTEALGCETGGVDGVATAADAVVAAAAEDAMAVETDGAERKRRAREEAAAESMMELEAGRAERCGGRLRLRLVPCAGCSNAAECHQKEKQLIKQEAEVAAIVVKEEEHEADDEATTEEEYGVANRGLNIKFFWAFVVIYRGEERSKPEMGGAQTVRPCACEVEVAVEVIF